MVSASRLILRSLYDRTEASVERFHQNRHGRERNILRAALRRADSIGTVHVTLPKSRLAVILAVALLSLSGCTSSGSGLVESGPRRAVLPLPGEYAGEYSDDWGASRSQGSHEGTDIYAPEGTEVRSITSGTVVSAEDTDEDEWNTLGGYTVNVRAEAGVGPIESGDALYYAHLRRPSALEPGDSVEAGQKIGEVGRTGGGPPVTREAGPPHLHLGWYVSEERQHSESGARNPYALLERLRQSGGSITVQPEDPLS